MPNRAAPMQISRPALRPNSAPRINSPSRPHVRRTWRRPRETEADFDQVAAIDVIRIEATRAMTVGRSHHFGSVRTCPRVGIGLPRRPSG